jgi:cell division protein FtsZ
MISYTRDPQQTIPTSSVKIIGLGGGGANILERVALDGMEGAELLAINTDVRSLSACVANEKIQLGRNLTKGLGTGGDPELGHQAMLEAETEIRDSLRGRRIVFLCVGLGGGTGSGAAPIVTRIAREEGAFVVVFATMPFAFEGKRRRDQAETALNELAVLSNALVTFDNNRMGELVLAKQGIHEAFSAADHLICESIKAVIRLAIRPGLINVGLDDLMSALRTNRSRCLFGSGIADGKDRASKALRNALSSPLLDQGALLKDAQTVLVHLSGGEDVTLYEIELLMQQLMKFVPEKAHVLFGAAIDPAMKDSLSITLISALPEDHLRVAPREAATSIFEKSTNIDPSDGFEAFAHPEKPEPIETPEPVVAKPAPAPAPVPAPAATPVPVPVAKKAEEKSVSFTVSHTPPKLEPFLIRPESPTPAPIPFDQPSFTDIFPEPVPVQKIPSVPVREPKEEKREENPIIESSPAIAPGSGSLPENDPEPVKLQQPESAKAVAAEKPFWDVPEIPSLAPAAAEESAASSPDDDSKTTEAPRLKLGVKNAGPQSELSFDSAPRGRFEGVTPNVMDGEDLDLPPFLRKKR